MALLCSWVGTGVLNRGYAAHCLMRRCSCLDRRPRVLGGCAGWLVHPI